MYSRKKYISLIVVWVISIVVMFATILMNIFARGVAPQIGLFDKTVDMLLDEAQIDMVPASWVQWYWVAIAVWQAAWLIYFGVNIRRKGLNDEPLILSPTLIDLPVLLLYTLTNAMNITGLILWSRGIHIGGLACMSIMVLFSWLALVSTCVNLSRNRALLMESDLEKEPWFIVIFLQNGLAMYASFCTFIFFIQLNTVITIEDPIVSAIDSTTIYFSILVFFVVLYFILDVTFLDRWLRYIFMPYISIIFVLLSILSRNWGARWLRNYRNPAYIASVLGVMLIFLLTKIVLTIGRNKITKQNKESDSAFLVESEEA